MHVESAADFHVAVAARVNQIAHMPGFWPSDEAIAQKTFDRYRISETDARLAGKKNIQVTTTLGERLASLGDPKMKDVARALLDVYRNLSLLKKNNVEILIGSDQFFSNSQGEAVELVRSGLMSAQDVLNAWCEITPRAIFPDRKIGKIKDGYEANLMVLASDPLTETAGRTQSGASDPKYRSVKVAVLLSLSCGYRGYNREVKIKRNECRA